MYSMSKWNPKRYVVEFVYIRCDFVISISLYSKIRIGSKSYIIFEELRFGASNETTILLCVYVYIYWIDGCTISAKYFEISNPFINRILNIQIYFLYSYDKPSHLRIFP